MAVGKKHELTVQAQLCCQMTKPHFKSQPFTTPLVIGPEDHDAKKTVEQGTLDHGSSIYNVSKRAICILLNEVCMCK